MKLLSIYLSVSVAFATALNVTKYVSETDERATTFVNMRALCPRRVTSALSSGEAPFNMALMRVYI